MIYMKSPYLTGLLYLCRISIGEFARLWYYRRHAMGAWQRRYGLLKPQYFDGGHRLRQHDDIHKRQYLRLREKQRNR